MKALPGCPEWTIIEPVKETDILYFWKSGGIQITPLSLIETWWAEEIKEEEFWIPKVGEPYFRFVPEWEKISIVVRLREKSESDVDMSNNSKYGLMFKTESEAKKRLLFLELSNSNSGFIPKEWEEWFNIDQYWKLDENRVVWWIYSINAIAIWNCYKTKEQAEKYAPKWKEYFQLLSK